MKNTLSKKVLETRKNFRFLEFGWEVVLEIIFARLEYLKSVMDALRPVHIGNSSARGVDPEQLLEELIATKKQVSPDEQISFIVRMLFTK